MNIDREGDGSDDNDDNIDWNCHHVCNGSQAATDIWWWFLKEMRKITKSQVYLCYVLLTFQVWHNEVMIKM
jgi:hypothetical protein